MSSPLLIWVPLLPMLVGLCLLMGRTPRWLLTLSLLPALLVVLSPNPLVQALPWLLLESRLALDGDFRPLLAGAIVVWWLGIQLLDRWDVDGAERRPFLTLFSFTMGGNFGVLLAADAVTFYLFYAVMGFACYGLILQRNTRWHRRAGRIYMTLLILGELALFAALVLLVSQNGTLVLAEMERGSLSTGLALLLLLAFAIKLGALPFHFGLPLLYQALPLPAAIVAGGAMINAGVVGLLQLLPATQPLPIVGSLAVAIGGISIFYGVTVGLLQRQPKALLGYSSSSQMGVILILVGVAVTDPTMWPALSGAIVIYALHHGLVKGALLLSLKAADMSRLIGQVGVVILAATLVGAPFTSGFAAKLALKQVLLEYPILTLVLTLGALGTTLLMCRLCYLLFTRERFKRTVFIWRACLWWSAIALLLLVPWLWPPARSHAEQLFIAGTAWAAIWPLFSGILIALTVLRWGPAISSFPTSPIGDGVVIIEHIIRLFKGAATAGSRLLSTLYQSLITMNASWFKRVAHINITMLESQLMVWRWIGWLLLIILGGFLWLGIFV